MTILNFVTLLICSAGVGALIVESVRIWIEDKRETETESPIVQVIERMYDNAGRMCADPAEANMIMLAMHTGPVLLDILESLPHEKLTSYSDGELHAVFISCCRSALRNQRAPRGATLN